MTRAPGDDENPSNETTFEKVVSVVNPRLTDGFRLRFNQDEVPFAVPHLKEDLPFAVDPFLLWKSSSPELRELHTHLVRFLELIVSQTLAGNKSQAIETLLGCREARELGLGFSRGTKDGSAIGVGLAESSIEILASIPQVAEAGISHLEVLGLVVPRIAQDRLSDITASVLKRHFVQFTQQQAAALDIPTKTFAVDGIWDWDSLRWTTDRTKLPYNPLDDRALLFAPLELLRHLPWINYEDYFKSAFSRLILQADRRNKRPSKHAVLEYNRRNFVTVERYVELKEQQSPACHPDPLFDPLQPPTLRRKLAELKAVPTGKDDGADKRYEGLAYDLLASLLYPEFEFADSQVRTVDGVHIRDVIFYNDGKTPFLTDLRERYGARQVVFELKNVKTITGTHVNQVYRYLDDNFGLFGVLVARKPLPTAMRKNVTDLHSAKHAAVIAIDDSDLELMINLLESGRRPIDAIKRRFIEFERWLPK